MVTRKPTPYPPKFPLPPIMNSLNLTGTPTIASYVPPSFLYRHNERSAFLSSLFETLFSRRETLSHCPHSHIVDPCMTSSQSRLVCAVSWSPTGETLCWPVLLKVRSRHQCGRLESVLCLLPGRFSLWCILALGNIDLNALCFDLNQLLPVYLYR